MSQGDWPNIQPLTTDRLFYTLVRALQRNSVNTVGHVILDRAGQQVETQEDPVMVQMPSGSTC